MRLAVIQGRGGLGRTFPNPSVGAVVYRGEPQIQHSIAGSGEVRPAR